MKRWQEAVLAITVACIVLLLTVLTVSSTQEGPSSPPQPRTPSASPCPTHGCCAPACTLVGGQP